MENFNIGQSYKETFVKVSRNTLTILLEILQASRKHVIWSKQIMWEKKTYLVRQSRTRRNWGRALECGKQERWAQQKLILVKQWCPVSEIRFEKDLLYIDKIEEIIILMNLSSFIFSFSSLFLRF